MLYAVLVLVLNQSDEPLDVRLQPLWLEQDVEHDTIWIMRGRSGRT